MSDQSDIICALGVAPAFSAAAEAARRIDFLKRYLANSQLSTYVLGISGGVDSLTAALLAQRAVIELRAEAYEARFIAVRLPYGQQADEHDAQAALAVITPDELATVNIKAAADAMMQELLRAGLQPADSGQKDFLLGNIKARQRMIAQYALAGRWRGLVIGTDHAAEAVMGFFTKHGDGAADILPLAGLNKRRVRALARHLGAPEHLVSKIPTADLETNAPMRPDEDAYGVTYEQIDDFLEGKSIEANAHELIIRAYKATAHKRSLPIAVDA